MKRVIFVLFLLSMFLFSPMANAIQTLEYGLWGGMQNEQLGELSPNVSNDPHHNALSVSSATCSLAGTTPTITITTTTDHGMFDNWPVWIEGASPGAYKVSRQPITKVNSTSFTYTLNHRTTCPTSPATGTIVARNYGNKSWEPGTMISNISCTGTTVTITTATNHGLTSGDYVWIENVAATGTPDKSDAYNRSKVGATVLNATQFTYSTDACGSGMTIDYSNAMVKRYDAERGTGEHFYAYIDDLFDAGMTLLTLDPGDSGPMCTALACGESYESAFLRSTNVFGESGKFYGTLDIGGGTVQKRWDDSNDLTTDDFCDKAGTSNPKYQEWDPDTANASPSTKPSIIGSGDDVSFDNGTIGLECPNFWVKVNSLFSRYHALYEKVYDSTDNDTAKWAGLKLAFDLGVNTPDDINYDYRSIVRAKYLIRMLSSCNRKL